MSTKTPDEEVRAKGMEFEGLCQKIGPLYTERGRIINCGGELSRVKLVEEDIHREICSIGMWYRLASEVSSELKQTFSRWQNERDDSLAGHIEKSTGLRLEEIDYKLREISWLENSIDGAKNELVKSNLSLVASAASNDAVAFSLGVVGLMDSTVKYDYRKNIKFSYFATFRIKKEIGRGYWNCRRGIRLPANKTEYTLEVRKETEMLKEKLKREPTDMEVWESISKKTSQKVSFADFMLLRNIVSGAISLDEYYGNNRDNLKNNNLVEVIQPVHYGNLNSGYGLHDFSRCDAKKDAKKLLSCLNDHEREIMEMRFGIGGGEEKTLEGIGRVFGVTRERIRQIEASALGKIRKFINNA
ncbi:hypothetical protein KY358_03500 [Candidatus Woesearchaeota archaeon]|nr:hypothetical protein [Candidatus Woesearchaeota archaeon]